MFGKNGQIVEKYDKYNVYEDPYIDTPLYPKPITFETDSGFKFGLAICFDINYLRPTQELLEKNVDAIIFQAAWVDELPFLTGLIFTAMAVRVVEFSNGGVQNYFCKLMRLPFRPQNSKISFGYVNS